ncbi:hypothetical protein EXW62_27655 (plasmid) [Bacillus mycoides]|uniref:hypothetical protein n=1 Tax=Bacillus mycoides TaxID=1405 RepID=UPI001C01771D|nr:hypothetical protein [Bacillus mycoides]QWH20769.1 hypothetical protein EXW62_27655 [Bacillus mycoides]
MKYLISDEYWDLIGYSKQLKALHTRVNKNTYDFFTNNSFHDAHIFDIKLINHFNSSSEDEEELDPTSLEARIKHVNGDEYTLIWNGVKKYRFDYDITTNTYVNSNEIVCEGARGIDEWGYDEIILLNEQYLSHEIILHSGAEILIHCREIDLKKY